MIYLKTEVDGVERKIEIYNDEFYTTCPKCGKEVQVCEDMLKDCIDDFVGTNWYCKECREGVGDNQVETMSYKEVLVDQISTLQQAQKLCLETGRIELVIPITSRILEIIQELDKGSCF